METLKLLFPREPPSFTHTKMKTDRVGTLSVVKLDALGTETHSVNGLHKTVHCVVKNNPLDLYVKLEGTRSTNFDRIGIAAVLHYDTEDLKKVDFVRAKPLTFKTRILQDSSEAVIQCLLKVLSSQHEDMFFRVRLYCIDSHTGNPIPGLEVLSPSIKVISKPEQLNKPKLRQKRKRPLHQEVVDQLLRIEQHQADNKELLFSIAQSLNKIEPAQAAQIKQQALSCSNLFGGAIGFTNSGLTQSNFTQHDQQSFDNLSMDDYSSSSDSDLSPSPISGEVGFEHHLRAMLDCYREIPVEERPAKIRRVMSSLDPRDSATFQEVSNSSFSSALFPMCGAYDIPASPLGF